MIRDDTPMYKIEGEVHPEYRRRGIGRWLFDWSIERSKARAAREDPGVLVKLTAFVEDAAMGKHGPPRTRPGSCRSGTSS